MRFSQVIEQLARGASTGERVAAIRAEHGRGAAAHIADALGISARQARRYLSGEVKTVPQGRAGALAAAAPVGRVAAARLRAAGGARAAGSARYRVVSKSDEGLAGTRDLTGGIGAARMIANADVRTALGAAAAALEAGDAPSAQDALSDALMTAYGAGGALSVADDGWGDGVTLT